MRFDADGKQVMLTSKRIVFYKKRCEDCQKLLDAASEKVKVSHGSEDRAHWLGLLQLRETIGTNLLLSRILAKVDPDGPDVEATAGRLFRDDEA
jgi:hypothetical protein